MANEVSEFPEQLDIQKKLILYLHEQYDKEVERKEIIDVLANRFGLSEEQKSQMRRKSETEWGHEVDTAILYLKDTYFILRNDLNRGSHGLTSVGIEYANEILNNPNLSLSDYKKIIQPKEDAVPLNTSTCTNKYQSGKPRITSEAKATPKRRITEADVHKALENQKKIGEAGEEFVMKDILNEYIEKYFQEEECVEINNITIERVSIGNATLGYDIKVTHNRVELRYIEVKSTTDKNRPFFMTDNEMKVAEVKGDKYFVYRVLVEKVGDTYIGKEIFEQLTPDEINEKYAKEPIAYRFYKGTEETEVDVKIFDTSLS